MDHFAIYQILTQYFKSTILQLKKVTNKTSSAIVISIIFVKFNAKILEFHKLYLLLTVPISAIAFISMTIASYLHCLYKSRYFSSLLNMLKVVKCTKQKVIQLERLSLLLASRYLNI